MMTASNINTQYACSSHIGTREYQQDAVETGETRKNLVYGILCDGMGGLDGGELASNIAVGALSLALHEMNPADNIPSFLVSQAHLINKKVREIPVKNGGLSGTTLTAAVIAGDRLFWLSVGDSRIYVIRRREIAVVTRDHSYSLELDEMVRAEKLSAAEAAADKRRDALISFMGMKALDLMDFNPNAFILEDGDMVLLCSDGLYRSLSDEEILELVLLHNADLDECARLLPVYAFDRAEGKHDNTSVVLLKYKAN